MNAPSHYSLSPEAARVCLPSRERDPHRRLAHASSICALFLLVGAVGLYAPPVHVRPVEPSQKPVEMIWEEASTTEERPQTTEQPGEAEPSSPERAMEPPAVIQPLGPQSFPEYVAAARPKLTGLTTTLPRVGPQPVSGPATWHETFAGAGADGGVRPQPDYPARMRQEGMHGQVVVRIVVTPEGLPGEVSAYQSSGFHQLDQHTCDWVKRHWRWPGGDVRYCQWKCSYVLEGK